MRDLYLLTTCGTSLLTNGAPAEERAWLRDAANLPELEGADAARLGRLVAARRERLRAADEAERRRLSAEWNGMGAALDRWPARRVAHLLLHTDTAPGRAAAEVIRALIADEGGQVELLTAGGLRTDDPGAFRAALADVTRALDERLPGYREAGWWVVFNLTGGFKSVNAYVQALGMVHADRCVFLFEGAPALMEIPRLPVRLADADEVRPHLDLFRRLARGYAVSEDEAAGAPEVLLLAGDGAVTTSVWGDVVWQRVRGTLLSERLLPPLSARVVVGAAAERAFRKLPAPRRVQVNEALDALSAHLDGARPLLMAHTLKRLAGDPRPPATHELYAWSDGAAGRIFGHFDGPRFVVDEIGAHL